MTMMTPTVTLTTVPDEADHRPLVLVAPTTLHTHRLLEAPLAVKQPHTPTSLTSPSITSLTSPRTIPAILRLQHRALHQPQVRHRPASRPLPLDLPRLDLRPQDPLLREETTHQTM